MGINEINYSQLILLYLPINKGVKTSMCQVSAFLVLSELCSHSGAKAIEQLREADKVKNKCLTNYITDLDQKALAKILPFVDYTFKLHLSLT